MEILPNPESEITYKDIRILRESTSESRIRDALRLLASEGILSVDRRRGRPVKAEDGIGSKVYRLNLELDILTKILDILSPATLEKLLQSKYINKLIEAKGLVDVFGQMEVRFRDPAFKSLASKELLNHPAAVCEYQKYPDKISSYLDNCRMHGVGLDILWHNEISILQFFDPLNAIPFIRVNLIHELLKLYVSVGGVMITSRSPHMIRLIEMDIHLSPFYSYPTYDPITTIFSHPFQRLFDDIYIMNIGDLKIMAERIHNTFEFFEEYIHLSMDNDWRYSICLKESIMEYIFLWNSQVHDFEVFYDKYKYILKQNAPYHIESSGGFIKLVDLTTGKNLLRKEDYMESLKTINNPPLYTKGDFGGGEHSPFEYLLPCDKFFKDFGFDAAEIHIDSILKDVQTIHGREQRRRDRARSLF